MEKKQFAENQDAVSHAFEISDGKISDAFPVQFRRLCHVLPFHASFLAKLPQAIKSFALHCICIAFDLTTIFAIRRRKFYAKIPQMHNETALALYYRISQ